MVAPSPPKLPSARRQSVSQPQAAGRLQDSAASLSAHWDVSGWLCCFCWRLRVSTLQAEDPDPAAGLPLCNRTEQVRDAIVSAVGASDCFEVTDANLSEITVLSLAGRDIRTLKTGDFASLTALQILNLNNNNLETLTAGVFADLSALGNLYLNSNNLTALPAGAFAGLAELETLELSGNSLTALSAGAFAGLAKLETLELNGNSLTALPESVFNGLILLENLYLDDNGLMELPPDAFTGLTALETLGLSGNGLTALSAGAFTGLTTLRALFLNDNNLAALSAGAFAGLTALRVLFLEGNRLTALPAGIFSGASTLTDLRLHENLLTTLPVDVFSGLAALKNLYLNDNNLAALPAGVFSSLGALSVLRLEGNPGSGDFLPIVDAGVNQVFDADQIVTLAAIISDVDPWGDNVTFVWEQIENGGDLVTLKDANTARPSFVMPAGTTALEFELTVTGRGGADFDDDDEVMVYLSFAAMPVCDRTAQVRDAIVAAVDGVSDCADVTESHLVNISSLILAYKRLSALQAGDFSGLVGLRLLSLNNNDLAELPAGIFDVLAGLSVLRLNNNNLAALPAGVFDDLTGLQILSLDSNRLTALPAGIFSGLRSLAELRLNGNPGSISFLPIANAGADQTVEAGQIATLTAIASDLDPWRGNVSYVWAQIDNGGDLVALKDANTARPSFVMPASAAALEFELTAIGRGGDRFAGTDRVRVRLPATAVPVCGRTAQVRDAIVEAVNGVNGCADITEGHLAGIIQLLLEEKGIGALQAGDFAGLTELEILHLDNNFLTELPPVIFDGLASLSTLRMNNNLLTELPPAIFDGLGALSVLSLQGNRLTALPADVFSGLAALDTLRLQENLLTTLSAGVFSDLAALQVLFLNQNDLTALPAGVFSSLGTLSVLRLEGNPGSGDFLPIADAGADQVVGAGADHTLTATVSDTDPWGDNVRFAWAQIDNGGDLVSLKDADTARPSFVMPAGTTALEFELTVTGLGDAGFADVDGVTVFPSAAVLPVCGRTAQVRDAIVGAVSDVSNCADITTGHLANISFLALADNGIGALQAGDFSGLTTLRVLLLNNNLLTALPAGVFSNLTELNFLILNNNLLTELPPAIFDGLGALSVLSLQGNRLTALPAGVFTGLAALSDLHLNSNRLATLTSGIFDGLPSLNVLDLNTNSLTVLPMGLFADLAALESLSLGGNSLTALPAGVFAGLAGLNALYLDDNSFTALSAGAFADLAALESLSLGGNSLTALPAGVFAGLAGLNALYLDDNSLTALSAGAFAGLAALESLSLGGNSLTALPAGVFAGLAGLNALYLDDNSLTALSAGAFVDLAALESLSLSGNSLMALPAGVFVGLAGLNALYLDDNSLTALPAGAFAGLAALESLGLSGNSLTALPTGLFSDLTALSTLHLHGNPGSEGFLPIANAGADQSILTGQIATLAATASDTDPWGDNVRYAWAQIDNGGDLVTLKDANTARPSFVMPEGATALEFELTVIGRGGAGYADTDSVTVLNSSPFVPVCDRTEQVLDVIVAAVSSASDCAEVTEADLAAITLLNVRNRGIMALKAGDFSGFAALEDLYMGGNSLSVLPEGIFAGLAALEELHLGGNGLTALPEGVFSGLTALQFLFLNSNSLTALPPTIFDGLRELGSLSLHGNLLTTLTVGIFSDLAALDTLLLNGNRLMELPPGIFNGLSALNSLHLYDNSLTALPAGLFSDLRELELLSLSGNSLTALPAGLFSDLRALMMLFLQGNPGSEDFLPIADAGAGQVVEAGQIVTLTATASDADPWGDNVRYAWAQIDNSGNAVVLMGADTARPSFVMPAGTTTALEFELTVTGLGDARYADADSVRVLDPSVVVPVCDRTEQVRDAIVAAVIGASGCADVTEAQLADIPQLFVTSIGIEALQLGDFSGLAALQMLNLNNNLLTALPAGIFADLTALEGLYLSDNNLTALSADAFASLAELETLDLSGNSLTALPAGAFAGLTALQSLYLDSNSLTALPAGAFDGLTALQSLYLDSNSLAALSEGVFNGLILLETLYLGDNSLMELPPDAFVGLAALETLNLSGNSLTALSAGAFAGLAALETLNLSGNSLTALPAGAFAGLAALETLNLSGIFSLPAGIFLGHRALADLHLHGNPGSEDFLPIASAGADQSIGAGQIATLTATASDTDPWGDNVRYAWAQIDNGGDLVTLKDANTARPSFVMPAAATALEFELTVTGLGGARYADTDSVRVRLPATVVTLAGPVHELLPEDATAIAGDELILVYSYSADNLRGRALSGSIEVAAAIDGVAITPSIEVDEDEGRGEITVVLRREKYPYPGEHELTVTLSLSAAAAGFVLGGTSSITTAFSFLPFPPTVLEVGQAEGNEGKRGAAGSDTIELGYIFEYAADNRLNRPRAGLSVQVDFELCTDGGYGECSTLPAASMTLTLDDSGSLTLRVDRTLAALSIFGEADADSIRHGRVLLSTADDGDFAAAAAATTFSFAIAAAVVTLSGPVPDPLPEDAAAIVGDVLSLVYSYSADDLRGRALTGSIEVAAAIDGLAVTPAIEVDEDEGRGEITVVLRREKYPYPGGHELTVTLSLGAAAAGFVLGGTSSITTAFSFLPFPPTVLEVGQAEGNEGKRGAAGSDAIELGYIFEYAADNRLERPRAGLSVQVDVELCADAGYGDCSSLPAASMTLTLDDSGSLALRVDRTAAALSVFGEADDDSIRHGRVLLSTAGNDDFAAAAAATTFSFAVAAAVVTLSGPVHELLPEDATAIAGDVLSLVYSYSADDLRGRVLTGSIEVAAAIDGEAITPEIRVAGVRGEITVVLRREKYPYPGEHELTVPLSLGAAAEGFVLGEPSSITTAFSFLPFPPTVLEVKQAEGNQGKRGAAGSDIIELGYSFEYAADNRLKRPRAGLSVQVGFELCTDAGYGECSTLPAASMTLTLDDSGSLALRVDRTAAALSVFGEADADSIRHGRVLLSTAGNDDFVATAAATTFSFAVAAAVVTLSGPVHELLPEDATAIAGDVLSLVYGYSADDLRGRVLTGSIEVAAAIDGEAITPEIRVAGVRGEITVVLLREKYPYPGEHQLAVTLSLGAAAAGFVLGEPSSITTAFSFLPFPPTVLEVKQAEGNQGKRGAAGSDIIELGYIFEYAAGNRLKRPRAGLSVQVGFELCTDAGYGECSTLPAASMTLTLDDSGSLTLRVDRTAAALSVFGEADADSIRHGRVLLSTAGAGDFAAAAAATTFSFAVAAAVVTLSGPVHELLPEDATAIAGDELSLVYGYSADDLRGRVP